MEQQLMKSVGTADASIQPWRHRSPRILYISPCWPHGESFGSQLRALHTCRALKHVGELSLAVVDYARPDAQTVARTTAEFNVVCSGIFPPIANVSLAKRLRR